MTSRTQVHKALFAVGSMGLFLLAPYGGALPGPVLVLVVLLPFALFYAGRAVAEEATADEWRWAGRWAAAAGCALHAVWLGLLTVIAATGTLSRTTLAVGVVMGLLGLVPAPASIAAVRGVEPTE